MLQMLEKYNNIFIEFFEDELEVIALEDLHYGESGWDSVMSMDLLAMFEQEFNIQIAAEDKMNFDTYKKGKQILSKYGIILD